jgi:hypothetical protein
VRFFVRSYSRRGGAAKHSKPSRRISQAAEDAAHGVGREVNHLGKAAEKSVGDLANNVMNKINGSGTPKSAEKCRNVSPSIESKVKSFETEGSEESQGSPLDRKKSQDSLRVSAIRKKASAEHNKLREMFEDGSQEIRSVDHSNTNATSKTKPNPTASLSRLQSADEKGKHNEKDEKEGVGGEKTEGMDKQKEQDTTAGAEQRENKHGSNGANEEEMRVISDKIPQEPKEQGQTENPLTTITTSKTEDTATAADPQNLTSPRSETPFPPHADDTTDTDSLPTPSSVITPPSPSRSSPAKNGPNPSSSIPILAPRPTPSPRNSSPTRISKIPKPASSLRSESPPKQKKEKGKQSQQHPQQKAQGQRSTPSPVKNILSKAKASTTSVAGNENGGVTSGSGAMAGNGSTRDQESRGAKAKGI